MDNYALRGGTLLFLIRSDKIGWNTGNAAAKEITMEELAPPKCFFPV